MKIEHLPAIDDIELRKKNSQKVTDSIDKIGKYFDELKFKELEKRIKDQQKSYKKQAAIEQLEEFNRIKERYEKRHPLMKGFICVAVFICGIMFQLSLQSEAYGMTITTVILVLLASIISTRIK